MLDHVIIRHLSRDAVVRRTTRHRPTSARGYAATAWITAVVALAVGTASCSGTTARGHAEMLLVAYPRGLTEVTLDGTVGRVVVPAANNATPASPTVSPDGARIAYLMTPEGGSPDIAADLWVADRDGSHRRRLVAHPSPGHSLRSPRWQDSRHLLVVVDRPATCAGCNPATTTQQVLERVDVASGATEDVRGDVVEYDVGPGARELAVANTASERGAALDITPLGDGAATEIVGLDQGFAEITSPRYRPDGTAIAFAAAQNRRVRTGVVFVTRAAMPRSTSPLPDGLPEDVWLVNADGSGLRLTAPLRESRPALAWSPDGATLYVAGAVALHRIDVATGTDTHIGPGSPQPGIAFAPAVGSN